jgi:hypothetical protein
MDLRVNTLRQAESCTAGEFLRISHWRCGKTRSIVGFGAQ